MEPKRVPEYLDRPMTVVMFDMDEVIIFIVCLYVWFMFGGWLLGALVMVVPWIYHKKKAENPRGYIQHLVYFIGLQKFKNYPEYFDYEFNE